MKVHVLDSGGQSTHLENIAHHYDIFYNWVGEVTRFYVWILMVSRRKEIRI
jgi:hypothetical protein